MIIPALRSTLILLGSAGYFGIAVIGSGGIGAFCANPARTGLLAAQIALSVAAIFAGRNLSAGVKEDRGNRWIIPVLGIIGLLQAFLPAWTDRHDIWCLDGDTIRWIGVVVFVLGGALRLWPVRVLGDRFSGLVAIQQNHVLVTNGIYRVIRHPSYLGLLVNMLGWAMAFRSGVGLILTAMIIAPLLARIAAEERLLLAQFGAEYEIYRNRTARLLPGLW